jgi:hypothetical protein
MEHKTIQLKKIIFIVFLLFFTIRLFAQDSTASNGTKQENWPEIDVYYKFNDRLRLYTMVSGTRLRASNYTDGAAGVYLDYFALSSLRKRFDAEMNDSTRGYYLWFRAGYYYSVTPSGDKNPVTEHTITTEAISNFHLPFDVLLAARNRFDWRIVNGDFNPRYRPRARFSKQMHTEYLHFAPYFYGEYYANLTQGSANRFRLCVGVDWKVAAKVVFETYYLHQFNNVNRIDAVNAIGLTLKLYFNSKAVRKMSSEKKDKK